MNPFGLAALGGALWWLSRVNRNPTGAGFRDKAGRFHPIRSSEWYQPSLLDAPGANRGDPGTRAGSPRQAEIDAREAALATHPGRAAELAARHAADAAVRHLASQSVSGELGGHWQSFRGDTAERNMHPDLITRLELASHATHAIVGRRDRTGPLHSEWFEGPDHRARAEAQSEQWARELLADRADASITKQATTPRYSSPKELMRANVTDDARILLYASAPPEVADKLLKVHAINQSRNRLQSEFFRTAPAYHKTGEPRRHAAIKRDIQALKIEARKYPSLEDLYEQWDVLTR